MLLALGGPVAAQVRRCALPDGITVYTDRRCADLGAQDAKTPTPAVAAPRQYRSACTRTLRELVFELGAAIDAHDGTRVASLYNWTGMRTEQAYAVLARLDAIAQRPLVQLVPVFPRGPRGEDPELYPQVSTNRAPVALRIEQTVRGTATPSRSVFALQKYFGCWWIHG